MFQKLPEAKLGKNGLDCSGRTEPKLRTGAAHPMAWGVMITGAVEVAIATSGAAAVTAGAGAAAAGAVCSIAAFFAASFSAIFFRFSSSS
jgi:hypothetical protein